MKNIAVTVFTVILLPAVARGQVTNINIGGSYDGFLFAESIKSGNYRI
jgi:hypothetical protein